MVTLETSLRLVGGVFLLFANGYFVTTEFAMTRVRQFSEEAFTGSPGLERAWAMTDRPGIYLSGCLPASTVSSVGLGVVAEPALAALFGPLLSAVGLGTGGAGHGALSVLLALGVMNLAHVVIGEQAPTYLGIERSRTVAKYCAPVLYYWTKLMGPVILLADWVAKRLLGLVGVTIDRSWAEEEVESEEPADRATVRRQMGDRLAGLGLSEDRREEVMAALDIDRVPVGDVMIPGEDVVALRVDEPSEQARERAAEHPHTRFPLVGDSLEDFRGVVYVPAVLRDLDALASGELELSDVAADPLTLSAGTAVSEAIDRFQDAGAELALVTAGAPGDDVGEVVGLVTATDLLEVISGEMEDPLDEETPAAGTR